MDPYDILGLAPGASAEDIKKAYRREAMKWHPDRCNNSAEARDRFHQAAVAYRILSGRHGNGGSGADASTRYREKASESARESAGRNAGEQGASDDSVFWDVMLDYAIRLAQSGIGEHGIEAQLVKKGCPARLAAVIAEKGFNIHVHYANGKGGKKRNNRPDQSSFRQERLESELFRAFVGGGNLLLSPRDTIDYYLVVFAEFAQSARLNPLSWVSVNRSLMRIFNFSILLFTVLLLAINFYPGPSEYKLLPDIGLLQLPLGLLTLMFVWSVFRKLWLFTLVLGSVYLATIAFFNIEMPAVLNRDLFATLSIAAVCYAPFVFIVLFGNYFYYRKARAMIAMAGRLFDHQMDRLVWIKNRAGTSSMAAFLFALIFVSSLTYYIPRNEMLADSFSLGVPGASVKKDDEAARKLGRRLAEAGRFFEIAESHFKRRPPDYVRAEMAYSTAAGNGSVLAAYKLGYLYYNGEGVQQNDLLALEYFQRAVAAPLAFQPHSLELVTAYLGESYNGLGIMYQRGFGARRNLPKAKEMFGRGAEFGSARARHNLQSLYAAVPERGRQSLAKPAYD